MYHKTRSGPKIPAADQLEGEEFFRFSDIGSCHNGLDQLEGGAVRGLDPHGFVVRFGYNLVRC